MKRLVFILALCASWGIVASAQHTVGSIRKEYQSVHEWIGHMMPDSTGEYGFPPEYYDLHVVQNLPATGGHHEYIRMFFEDDEEVADSIIYPPHILRFVTSKYNFAASEFYEEYLYDKKGRPMFIYAITPYAVEDEHIPYELRMYFDGARLLRFTAKKADNVGRFEAETLQGFTYTEVYSGATIPEKYRMETDRCIERASQFLTLFRGIDDNTYK